MSDPVYNARILDMLIPARFPRLACWLLVFVPAWFASASVWQSPSAQLARKISAATGPGAVALDVVNRSSLSRADADEIRRELTAELAPLGVHFVSSDQASATVQVSLSENLQDYVWVAEIRQGTNEPAIVMVRWPRPETAVAERPQSPLTIRKVLLTLDENRILDVALLNGSPQHMIALEPDKAVLFTLQNGRWQQDQVAPITTSHPWPRDLRGRLVLRKDRLFDAYLPGLFCRSAPGAGFALNCYERDDPWPIGAGELSLSAFFAPTRNFFTGALSPGIGKQTMTSSFYSAAPLPRDKYTLWVLAAADGQVHLLDGITDQVAGTLDWGSDIASVKSTCGPGWQLLASASGEGGDTVKAFEIADREAVAASPPVEFNGGITALWTETDGTAAIAVSRNSETRKYEAYRLSITCSQ